MATSGQVNSIMYRDSYLYVKWSRTGTWNETTCGSYIKWELWLHNGNWWYTNAIRCYDIYIDNSKVSSGGVWSNYTTLGDFKLLEGTTSVTHSNDGTKTFNINFDSWFYSYSRVNNSQDFTLDTIPRASTFTTSGNTIGSEVIVSINRADNTFTHTVTLKFGNKTETKTNIATGTSFTPNLSEYGSQIPNSMSGNGTMTVDTYSGNNKIGTKSQSITLNLPSNTKPSVPTVTLTEAVAGIAEKFGAYIQKKSKINVQATANGIYGSTIISYEVTINGTLYNIQNTLVNINTGVLYNAGSNTCKVKVKDSREQETETTVTFNVLAYQDPQIVSFTAIRNENTPTTLNCVFSVSITPLTVNGTNKNTPHSITLKLDETSNFTDTTNYTLTNQTQNITNVSDTATHTVTLSVTDYFTTSEVSIPIGTGFALMNFSADGKHMAIGQIYDSNLNVDLQIRESLAVGGVKALYKDANDCIAGTTLKYQCNTVTVNNNTYNITFKRSGNVVTVSVTATIKANTSGNDGARILDFPEWAKNYNEANSVRYSYNSTISEDGYANFNLIKSSPSAGYILFNDYSNTSVNDEYFRTIMTYIIEN